MKAARYVSRIATLLSLGVAVACGSGGSPTSPGTGRTITASSSLTFAPATLTVSEGDEVTFAFQQVAHNVFFDAVAGAPANIEGSNANVSVSRTFATAGTFHYTCHIHAGMQGTVVVQ